MINANYEAILNYVYENESSLELILKGLNDPHIDAKLNAINFLVDLCNNSKLVQVETKQGFFSKLIDTDLFSMLTEIMIHKEQLASKNPEANPNACADPVEPLSEMKTETTGMKSNSEEKDCVKMPILKIEGEELMHKEYNVNKLDLLKIHVAEILTSCFQIMPGIPWHHHSPIVKVKEVLLSESEKKANYTILSRLILLFLHSNFDGMKLEVHTFHI